VPRANVRATVVRAAGPLAWAVAEPGPGTQIWSAVAAGAAPAAAAVPPATAPERIRPRRVSFT